MDKWTFQDVEKTGKYIGILEFQSNDEEWQNFEIMETDDKLVFGGICNTGFIESGYIEKQGFSTDETFQELLEDLKTYYNDGKDQVSFIICNERM